MFGDDSYSTDILVFGIKTDTSILVTVYSFSKYKCGSIGICDN